MEGGEGRLIGCGHNGVVWLNVVVHGRPAHGSTPERGINALEKMAALVLALEDYKRRLARRRFLTPDGREMHPTINVGGVFAASAGGKINTVPAEASFSIDRRVIATETVADAERELRTFLAAAARRIPHCHITIEKVVGEPSVFPRSRGSFLRCCRGQCEARARRTSGFPRFYGLQRYALLCRNTSTCRPSAMALSAPILMPSMNGFAWRIW